MSEEIAGMGKTLSWRDASSISETAIDLTEAIVSKLMITAGRGSLG